MSSISCSAASKAKLPHPVDRLVNIMRCRCARPQPAAAARAMLLADFVCECSLQYPRDPAPANHDKPSFTKGTVYAIFFDSIGDRDGTSSGS